MSLCLAVVFPLIAILFSAHYAPLSLGLVLLAAWRYGLLGASLAGCWAGLWAAVPCGLMLPQMVLPPLLVGCLAGYVIERRPVLSASQRLVMGGVFSAVALLLQLFLSGYSPFMVAQALLVCWWSWALLSAGLFWVSSYVFPWREW
ncbi:hypothetical protein IV102_03650 [bacterium]|nr:hypothetical protein [bacterium]